MEKQRMKKLSFLLGTGIIIGILGIVYIAFSSSFDRVYGLLLEKDMIQTEFTSKFVTRLIETEIENVMASLQVSQGVFLKRENEDLDQMKARLNALRIELKFEEMGICDLEGVGIDCRGSLSGWTTGSFSGRYPRGGAIFQMWWTTGIRSAWRYRS